MDSFKALIIVPLLIFIGILIGAHFVVAERESRCEAQCTKKGMNYEYRGFATRLNIRSNNLKSDRCTCVDRAQPD
ncbi:MAG: hypothetical protein NVV73_13365 [Cellvibrionaceae bacterium]|nr:hypothetical protein [Cellvibrionaceae bacterium]